jgi:plasmid replication initiation protein
MSAETMLSILKRAQENQQRKTANPNVHAIKDRAITKNTVTKAHGLTRAFYRFGLVEKRCMEALISKLHPMRTDNPQRLELTAKEYAQAYGVNQKIAYRDIAGAIDRLLEQVITAEINTANQCEKIRFNLMDFAEYRASEGRIVCGFTYTAMPLLTGLTSKFSSYPLSKAVNFKSSYTWRFYELLVSWAKPGDLDGRFGGWIINQDVEELRNMLGVPKSYRWKHLTGVLETAVDELEQELNLSVFIERKKTGRKITHMDIQFIENEQPPTSQAA